MMRAPTNRVMLLLHGPRSSRCQVWPLVAKAVDTGRFDTVLCWYNAAMAEATAMVFPAAARHGTGVVIMNASARGGAKSFVDELSTVAEAPAEEQFYRYVLTHPDVDVSVMGLRDIERFRTVGQVHILTLPS